MKELETLCRAITENKYKSIQKCIDLYHEDLVLAKNLYGWAKVTDFINQQTGNKLKESFLQNMVYRASKKKNPDSVLTNKKTTIKENLNASLKKSSTTTIEKVNNSSIDFSKFTNLNKFSKKLIADHNLTLEDLNEIGIRGIADDMTVYEKINHFCEKKVSQEKRKKYAHLLKKD
ncbi:hypothetical protein AB7W78_18875 [Providencia rettgeri]